ncbi:hypothetical protein DSC45_27055 [Streptomyces sp. YIM 130001]|uniref:hypothetical protein n=1 Tax=Streptomyces sp. YIM 130001 TaxID=2259644 RepID=UPI000E64AC73|nr:hypothetical protein [Streptomyces sp. YIM 130001]RII11959.1 hypothetical protein DSC45_27055 [Streptomyces sp. YIM 130001]
MDRAWIRGRRGAVIGASAAVVCLGSLLAACGAGASTDGHVPLGAAGSGPSGAPQKPVPPSGEVTLVPLDGKGGDGGQRREGGGSGAARGEESGSGGSGEKSGSPEAAGESGAPGSESPDGRAHAGDQTDGGGSGAGTGSGAGGSSGGGGGQGDGGAPKPGTEEPAGPAALKVGEPVRAEVEKRWCDRVTVKFHNSGGTAVRSGTVTFGTHVIGGLGVDWATVESTEKLPVPIAPGATAKKTWTVCVAEWRVPLGMHVETQDVAAKWK